MKRFALALLTFALFTPLVAQQPRGLQHGSFYASDYNFTLPIKTGTTASGAGTFVLGQGSITLATGREVPLSFIQTVRTLDGASAETITITATAGCSSGSTACTLTFTSSSNAHGGNTIIGSGTFGLDLATADANSQGGGQVVVDTMFGGAAGAAGINSTPFSNVVVVDLRNGPLTPVYYAGRPSAITLIAAPSAVTVTAVAAGGSLSSGAYKATAAYVDCMGGISLDSTESSASATATAVTISAPAASTGACGWLPRLSTAGGSANEILAASPLTSANCTLSTSEIVIPACAIGAIATVSAANPSATAKPSVEANAFTTYAYAPFQAWPTPFNDSYPFGVWVVTATLNASNADAAHFVLPAGYMNFIGKKLKVCVKGATATQVASSTFNVNLTMATEYAQTIRTIASADFPTNTEASAGSFGGCFLAVTSVTGSSGKIWGATESPFYNRINTANTAGVVSGDASAALPSTLDLTKQIYVAVNLQGVSANNVTGPIINSLEIVPAQ